MTRQPDLDRFTSRRSTVYAPNGLVATSQPLAAEVGVHVLRSGGNAFDAAVATAAALNVVEPTSTGIGGDAFALFRTADGEVGAMRSCGGAPADTSIEKVRSAVAENTGADPESVSMPKRGPHAVTVPGSARGWETTVAEFGRLDLGTVLQPAIELAADGYPVTEMIAHHWAEAAEVLDDDHARDAYLPDGRPPEVGERVTLPALGRSLRRIAEDGADVVYEGEIAEAIAEEVQSKGGFLTVEDLASFEPELLDPARTTYGDATVYELPPNNQGFIALEALNVAEAVDAGDAPFDSAERVHYFAEAMKRAFHDGHRYVTDPEFEDVPDLTSKAYARRRAESITTEATDVTFGVPDESAANSDTVMLSVADDAGNLVAFINSRYAGFGSGLVAGDTGIALQNRGHSFSLDPEHPNALEPGKRPFHTLIPAIAEFGPDDWAAFGVKGGSMQPQGHLQLVSNVVDYGVPLQAALDEPRWRYLEDGQLAVEARMDEGVVSELMRMGHDVVVRPPERFGGAQIVRREGDVLSGATDPRKDGAAVGY